MNNQKPQTVDERMPKMALIITASVIVAIIVISLIAMFISSVYSEPVEENCVVNDITGQQICD